MVLNILKILIILGILVQTFSCVSLDFDNPNDPRNNPIYSSSSSEQGSSSSSSSEDSSSSSSSLCNDGERLHFGVCKSEFIDERDGKKYVYVTIGEQTWMAENLNYDGSPSSSSIGYCYENEPDNCGTYGRLYNWDTAKDVCPQEQGWSLPDNEDWGSLVQVAGDMPSAGKKLKANSTLWNTDTGTDDYGFSALPGGSREENNFKDAGIFGNWWTATTGTENSDAYHWYMSHNNDAAYKAASYPKTSGFSVRCIKKVTD
jgi:uncharacterized protein (TIGR02145 family)